VGVLDVFRSDRSPAKGERPALEAALDGPPDTGAVARLIQVLMDVGLDGVGPLKSATEMAERARRTTRTPQAAVAKVARRHVISGGAGGFVTGVGGFVTMPVALPANLVEFYVQATRMVGSIAVLRGYDVRAPQVRTAVLLTLVGSHADEILARAGMTTPSGRMAGLAARGLPPSALPMLNKAVGFRLMRGVGEKAFSRLGRGVPLAGGVIGGGIDVWMMKRIADHAMEQFPPLDRG
jgi:hypothetical protein